MSLEKDKFFYLIFFFYILYIFNIFLIHHHNETEVFLRCHLLTYDGGFVRRGLLGDAVSKISIFFKINYVKVFNLIFLIIYSMFFYLFYKISKNFRTNFIFFFIIFTPINFFYPLIRLDWPISILIIQKEIFIITFFIFYNYLIIKNFDRKVIFSSGIIGVTFLSFLYELVLFVFPFFILSYLIYLLKNKYMLKKFEIFISLTIFFLIIYIQLFLYGSSDLNVVFQKIYEKHGVITSYNDQYCTYDWMNRSIKDQILSIITNVKISQILRYVFYSHPIIILVFLFFKYSKNNLLSLILVLSVLSASILFIIATDWARFVHIIFLLTLISFLTMFANNQFIFKEIFNNSFLFKINKYILNFFLIVYCLSWTLKQTFWQNHMSYGGIKIIYKSIEDLYRYFL